MWIYLTRAPDGARIKVRMDGCTIIQPSASDKPGQTFLVGPGVTVYVRETLDEIDQLQAQTAP
jgi:adenylosuccinate synthase